MTFVVPVIATKAANAYKTIFFQRQKGHKKSKLPIFCILAVTAFSISSARDVNGFTILDASLTGAGGGAANDPQQPYPLLQDRLRKALTEKYHENAESIFVSEGVNTREEEESNDSDDIDEAMPPLSTTVDKFDEAMNRACSPSIKNSLFDNLGQPVTEAVNLMDRWMNSVLGAMTTLESDSTPLYEYLSGTGSLTAVIKGSCLFGLSILAGILVASSYILCCLPKLCCKYLRRLCCCAKCCSGQSKLCSRLLKAILLAAFTLSGIVFACLVLMYQKKGVQGAKQAYCQAYAFTDELLRGSPSLGTNVTQVDEPQSDEFEGLLPLIESVESLALLVDGDNPNNIVELSKKAATNALDVVPMAGEMTRATKYLSDACASLSAKTSLSGSFHKSVWCDIRKRESGSSGLISTEEKMSTSAQKIIQINPKKYVETIFSKVTLPALNIEATLPTENVKELFFTVFDILGDTEETISKVLGWLDAALSVDCAIYLAILLLVVLWAAWFFFRGSKTNGLIPAFFWNVLTWVAVALLVVGGALGWITTLGKQGCSILINNCLEQDNWDLLSDYVPVVEPLISQCLTKEGDGDLLAGVGLDAAYDQMLKALQETLAGFPTNISSLDKETSELAENYLRTANSFGALVVADPSSVTKSRKEVFPEFLTSGMQLQDADIDGKTLYGLETLESLVAPWKLLALHPDEPADGEFIVREDNPTETDNNFVKWLASLKENKMAELLENGIDEDKAEAEAERFKVWTNNGIWWLQQKQRVLDLKYTCKNQAGMEELCGFAEMFGLNETDIHASCMYNNQSTAAQTYLQISSCFVNAVSDSIGEINDKVINPLEQIKKALNCRFLRRNIVQIAALACESTVHNFYYVAIYRALGGAIACLVVLALFILWSTLKKNNSPKGLAGPNSAA